VGDDENNSTVSKDSAISVVHWDLRCHSILYFLFSNHFESPRKPAKPHPDITRTIQKQKNVLTELVELALLKTTGLQVAKEKNIGRNMKAPRADLAFVLGECLRGPHSSFVCVSPNP
jgi:hypothetical protein